MPLPLYSYFHVSPFFSTCWIRPLYIKWTCLFRNRRTHKICCLWFRKRWKKSTCSPFWIQ